MIHQVYRGQAFSVDSCRFDHSKIGCDEPKSFMHIESIADDLFLWSKGLLAANFLLQPTK